MDLPDIEKRLREILETDFRVPAEKIGPSSTFRGDMGLDSLDAVDLILFVSREFGLKPQVDAFRDLHTFQKVAQHLFETTRGVKAG